MPLTALFRPAAVVPDAMIGMPCLPRNNPIAADSRPGAQASPPVTVRYLMGTFRIFRKLTAAGSLTVM